MLFGSVRLLVRGRRPRVAQKVPRNLDSRPDRSRRPTGGHHHHYSDNWQHSAAAASSIDPTAVPSGGQTGYPTCPADDDDNRNDNRDFKQSESAADAPSPTGRSQIADGHWQTCSAAARNGSWQPCRPIAAAEAAASFPTGATSLVRFLHQFVVEQCVVVVVVFLLGSAQNEGSSVAIGGRRTRSASPAAIAAQSWSTTRDSTPHWPRPAIRIGADSFQLDGIRRRGTYETAQTSTVGGVPAEPVATVGGGRVPAAAAKLQGIHQHVPETLRHLLLVNLVYMQICIT